MDHQPPPPATHESVVPSVPNRYPAAAHGVVRQPPTRPPAAVNARHPDRHSISHRSRRRHRPGAAVAAAARELDPWWPRGAVVRCGPQPLADARTHRRGDRRRARPGFAATDVDLAGWMVGPRPRALGRYA